MWNMKWDNMTCIINNYVMYASFGIALIFPLLCIFLMEKDFKKMSHAQLEDFYSPVLEGVKLDNRL